MYWQYFIFLLLSLSIQLVNTITECLHGRRSCGQCYTELVRQILLRDDNIFELRNGFFPPDKAPPVYVVVTYEYLDQNGTIKNSSEWYWSTSTFYLYHPLPVFQFTSLLFSDFSRGISAISLKLNVDCRNASISYMRLLTQRLKLLATENSLNPRLSNDYDPKSETVETIKAWIKEKGDYPFGALPVFPIFLSLAIIPFVVIYYNEFKRSKKIKCLFSRKNQFEIREIENALQNEFISSLIFIIYVLSLAGLGVYHSSLTGILNNNDYNKYFNIHHSSSAMTRYMSNFSVILLVIDAIIFVSFLVSLLLFLLWKYYHKKEDETMYDHWLRRYCPYSIIFPLCSVANHLNYIIIAFIHDVHNAISVAFIYGIVAVVLYCTLTPFADMFSKCCVSILNHMQKKRIISNNCQLYHVLDNTENGTEEECSNYEEERSNDEEGRSNDEEEGRSNDEEGCGNDDDNAKKYIWLKRCIRVTMKFVWGLFVTGFLTGSLLVYYYLPINNAFDDATFHLMSLYQTTAVFFAAIVAYLFLKKPDRSPIQIFTRAENKFGELKKMHLKNWNNESYEDRDMEMARIILNLLTKASGEERDQQNNSGAPRVCT